jgi:Ca2+/Na+ antiporter
VLFVLEWPFCLARALSIPTTDLGWGPTKRYFTALSFPGGVLCVLVTFFGTDFDASTYVIASAVGVVFGAFFLLTSSDGSDEERATKHTLINDDNKDEDNKESQLSKVNLTAQINPSSPMRAGQMWLYPLIGLAFMSSVGWLNAIAGEAVAASLVIAGASGLSSSVVGLTLLAWGNSIGDYVADVAVCNAGSPYTAVSSCIGSPMLSAIIGICLSVVVNLTGQGKIGEGVPCNLDTNSYVSYAFLLIAQVMTMFVTVTNNYKIPVSYYKYLWVLYALFLVVVVTIEVSGNNSA